MFLHRFVVIRKIITKGARGKVGTSRENRVRDLQFFIHVCATRLLEDSDSLYITYLC